VKKSKTNYNHLSKTKIKWDSLASTERADFIARVAAEKSVKEFLKSDPKAEYNPINYYAKFLEE
jgi:hypothetical protein